MPYLKPESTSDTFDVFCRVTDGGNPYRFHVLADIRGQLLDVDGLSMGELPSVLLAVGLCAFWRWLWDDDDERSRHGYGY